jgi:hypothetical protein
MEMQTPIEQATAYLDKLEADRQAAIAASEQKAEEAKLIRARQEGFQAAMNILGGRTSLTSSNLQTDKSARRSRRRDISQMIVRELSFSGKAMSTSQIAKAINYLPERTETALKRLENAGELTRDEHGRWAIIIADVPKSNGRAAVANGPVPSAMAATG